MVFRCKICPKMTKARFQMKHSHIFLFFCPVFSETRATILAVFTCFWGLKLETPRWYSLKPGADPWWNSLKHGGLRPPVSMNPSRLGPRFQWNHRGFQVLSPKNTWNRQNRRPSFTETGRRNGRFPFNPTSSSPIHNNSYRPPPLCSLCF